MLWLIFSVVIVVALSVVSSALKHEKMVYPTNVTSQDNDEDKNVVSEKEVEKPEKYRDSSLNDETRRNLIVKIEEVMNKTDVICDSDFSLQKLKSLVGSNTSYISRAINEHYGVTFGNLLNRYRIQEACRRMGDTKKYGNLTIEAISESVGFNTRATFVKAFRLNIGMLPSEYIKLLKKEQRQNKEPKSVDE